MFLLLFVKLRGFEFNNIFEEVIIRVLVFRGWIFDCLLLYNDVF